VIPNTGHRFSEKITHSKKLEQVTTRPKIIPLASLQERRERVAVGCTDDARFLAIP
jgi:hypothetical protein